MKLWGILFFVSSLNLLHATSNNVADIEEKPTISIAAHVDEKTSQQEDPEATKADLSSTLKETAETFITPSEEAKESVIILSTPESSAVGGGLLRKDPTITLPPEIIAIPFKDTPSSEATPWWERWWSTISGWFLAEPS